MTKIGFIGTGVMGSSMAYRLLKAGHELHVYTRTKAKAAGLLGHGAIWEETPKAIAQNVDVVITMIGYPSDVETIYLEEGGLLENMAVGKLAIDMTTSSPTLAARIAEEAGEKGVLALDAPVSGGDIGAANGALSIMVGGTQEAFEKARALFEVMGKTIQLQGGPGAGQHTKMVNQIAIASNMIGVTEALFYAENVGLDPNTVLASIQSGAAGSWSLSNLTPRVIKDDLEPGFFIKHFIKDMRIALDEAKRMDLKLPGLELAEQMYQKLADNGLSEKGTQALIQYYR